MPVPLNRPASLLVVDAQLGFTTACPAELPVPGGLEIVPAVNRLLALPFARIDATQDWHPPDHRSFLGRPDQPLSAALRPRWTSIATWRSFCARATAPGSRT